MTNINHRSHFLFSISILTRMRAHTHTRPRARTHTPCVVNNKKTSCSTFNRAHQHIAGSRINKTVIKFDSFPIEAFHLVNGDKLNYIQNIKTFLKS